MPGGNAKLVTGLIQGLLWSQDNCWDSQGKGLELRCRLTRRSPGSGSYTEMEPLGNTALGSLLFGVGEAFGNAVLTYWGLSCVHGLFIMATLAQEKENDSEYERKRRED